MPNGSIYNDAHFNLATPHSSIVKEYVQQIQANGRPDIISPILRLNGKPINVNGSNVHSFVWTSK